MLTCRHRGLGISTSVQQFLLPSFLYIMCARTFIMHWLRLFVVVFNEIPCLLNFVYDVGHQGLEIYPCSVFLCQLHAHTYAIKNVLAETVFCGFPRNTVFTKF